MRTALTEVDTAFRFLVCQPAPLAFDGHLVDGLPNRMLPLDELRDLLVAATVSADTRDAVWCQLIRQARDGDPTWVVATVGVAAPGLTRLAARLTAGFSKIADDIHSEILAGFLHALRTEDLAAPRIWIRLCWAAWRAGYRARRLDDLLELPPDLPTGSRTPHRPYGHPDLILGRAVAANILTPAQAELIGSTRLGDALIEQIAAECGVAGSVVRMRRKRAERRLVTAVRSGDLAVPRRTVTAR
jgi:DNA-directed RNA polymerase specialized sigma24 family protein